MLDLYLFLGGAAWVIICIISLINAENVNTDNLNIFGKSLLFLTMVPVFVFAFILLSIIILVGFLGYLGQFIVLKRKDIEFNMFSYLGLVITGIV